MFFQLPSILTVPLTALLLLVLVGAGPASNVFSQSSNQGGINIDLLSNSSPRFFECDVTPINGTSSVNGLNSEESAQNVLTDGNLDTAIMGDARFDVHFNEPITNHPGPEIKVVELSGVEPFNVSAGFSNMTENSISVTPQSINETNGCNYSINEAQIDLQDLGITEGSSVPFISFDNLGEADSLLGSDIADISIIDNQTNTNTTTIHP